MKKILSLVLCLCAVSLSFFSCSDKKVTVTTEGDGIYTSESGTVYKYAPVGYEPTSQGEEYGLLKGVREEKLYRIGTLDPEKWMTTEYAGAMTTVFYSEDITLPTVYEMEPTLCYICEEEEEVFCHYILGGAENGKVDSEREVIRELLRLLADETAEEVMWPRMNADETYDLKLYSEEWPAIYYCVEYIRESGGNYVYDSVSKRCISVGELLEGYFENEV